MKSQSNVLLLLSVFINLACTEIIDVEKMKQICQPGGDECANEDLDNDEVINSEDDLSNDPDCTIRNDNNCTSCGIDCAESETCDDTGECIPYNTELCDGDDNDGDGEIDENINNLEMLSQRQDGLCNQSKQVCSDGQWIEPDYSQINGYEDIETICDGLDNDCDALVDESVNTPLAINQAGVCAGIKQVCNDGALEEPNYLEINGYELTETACDGVDNDCDGAVDEELTPPLADLQDGVCVGTLKAICSGAAGWVEPDYSLLLPSYNEIDVLCDNQDNDCDGVVDEGGVEHCRDNLDNDCDGTVDESECSVFCGDGFLDVDGEEECDDGEMNSDLNANACRSNCRLAYCGDGVLDEGEECDSGEANSDTSPDACRTDCRLSYCGDGVTDSGESCDDGNTETEQCIYGEEACTVCSANCSVVAGELVGFCGDGTTNGLEECDGEEWCNQDCLGSPPPCALSSVGCPELDFVTINGGTFMMGSSVNQSWQPIHSVTLGSFKIMRSEMTVGQYRLCVNANACSSPRTGNNYNWSSSPETKENYPINGISWYQAMEYAAWVGARLPSAAEWEYAARGEGQEITYPWGNTQPTCTVANYSTCNSGTESVCSHPTGNSDQGLCEMSGNVWEWVQDEYHSDYIGAPNDGSGWCTGDCPVNASDISYDANDSTMRIVRGGSYYDGSTGLRAAHRGYNAPTVQYDGGGARLSR